MATISIIVVPRSSKSQIVGMLGDRVKIKLAAPPVDGAANKELIKLLAKELGVAKSAVRIVSGDNSKRKTIEIEGIGESDVAKLIEKISGRC